LSEPHPSRPEPVAFLREHAPWLWDPALAVCIVGSQALALACQQAGLPGPQPVDLDLAWSLDHDAGKALLEQRSVFVPTTAGNVERGTLAMKLGGRRLEVTTFRSGSPTAPAAQRIASDLAERDMTIGASCRSAIRATACASTRSAGCATTARPTNSASSSNARCASRTSIRSCC
jgi:hypothetical protein